MSLYTDYLFDLHTKFQVAFTYDTNVDCQVWSFYYHLFLSYADIRHTQTKCLKIWFSDSGHPGNVKILQNLKKFIEILVMIFKVRDLWKLLLWIFRKISYGKYSYNHYLYNMYWTKIWCNGTFTQRNYFVYGTESSKHNPAGYTSTQIHF